MRHRSIACAALVIGLLSAAAAADLATVEPRPPLVLAESQTGEPRPLEPRYQPVPPEEESWYNDSYIFALSRGLAASTLVPALKAPLFVLALPLDVALLPFAAIGGLFG